MHGLDVVPAGPRTQAIEVPRELQDSLLQYDVNTTEHLREAAGGGCDATRSSGAGEKGVEDREERGAGGDILDAVAGGACRLHVDDDSMPANDVPNATVPPVAAVDTPFSANRRVRNKFTELAQRQLLEGQIMSSLGVGNSVWAGVPSLYCNTEALVADGAAMAVINGFDVSIIWLTRRRGRVLVLCSCGDERRATCVETMRQTGKNSTCAHAVAMRLAVEGVASRTRLASVDEACDTYPVLMDNKNATATPKMHVVRELRKMRKLWAVHAQNVWGALVQPIKSAANQAPRCKNILCRSSRRCLHSLAYFQLKRSLGAGRAEDSSSDSEYNCDGGAKDKPENDAAEDGSPPDEVADDNEIIRRARNLLPCKEEVRIGVIFDSYGRAVRDSPTGMGALPAVFHERKCMRRETARGSLPLETTDAILHTMSGRVSMRTGSWTCGNQTCGKGVRCNGADSGLFAWSSKTIYTLAYLEVLKHMAMTSRSSVSAAASAMTICQHVTAALYMVAAGQTRQVLNVATGYYSETSTVPSRLYSCSRFLESGHKCIYETLVSDGQTLGISKQKTAPLVRRLVDNPVVDVLLSVGCVVQSAATRAQIRKRCTARISSSSGVTAAERRALEQFVLEGAARPSGPRMCDNQLVGQSSTGWAAWAAIFLFCFFFTCSVEEGDKDSGSMDDSGSAGTELSTAPRGSDGPSHGPHTRGTRFPGNMPHCRIFQ